MEIEFEKPYLEELYRKGKTKDKKHRFPKGIPERYIRTIDKLRVAERIEDLFVLRSLRYEKLVGDKNDLESVRVNDKYRIEFRSSVEGEEPNLITICSIKELSNHYK